MSVSNISKPKALQQIDLNGRYKNNNKNNNKKSYPKDRPKTAEKEIIVPTTNYSIPNEVHFTSANTLIKFRMFVPKCSGFRQGTN